MLTNKHCVKYIFFNNVEIIKNYVEIIKNNVEIIKKLYFTLYC